MKARALWDKIGRAAWASADPGLQYDTTINDWHTCPAAGPIRASNPCSEYMFLDDTACNLASMNLLAFQPASGAVTSPRLRGEVDARSAAGEGEKSGAGTGKGQFDIEGYEHAVRLWTVVLE